MKLAYIVYSSIKRLSNTFKGFPRQSLICCKKQYRV